MRTDQRASSSSQFLFDGASQPKSWQRFSAYSSRSMRCLETASLIAGGAVLLSAPVKRAWSEVTAWAAPAPPAGLKIAMVAHVYYTDLLQDILACHASMPSGTVLHLTAPPEKSPQLSAALRGRRDIVIHEHSNRGRDIGPFMTLLNHGVLDSYDAVLKIHTKKSPHSRGGGARRRWLFAELAGSTARVNRILALFRDPATGVAGWGRLFRTEPYYWFGNERRTRGLLGRMGPAAPTKLGFFEGSMFWFRPAALTALRALHLDTDDFEPELGQLDGTLHHALERCFGAAAAAVGFRVLDLQGHVLLPAATAAGRQARFSAQAL